MDNTFVWTDDLVKEYIKYLQQGKGCGKWHPMEEFKKSKEVKKDYEIECIVKDSRNYWRQKDQLYNSELFGSHDNKTRLT